MTISWSIVTVSLDYSELRAVITQGGGIVTTVYNDVITHCTQFEQFTGLSIEDDCAG
jgi:hypothetical protein